MLTQIQIYTNLSALKDEELFALFRECQIWDSIGSLNPDAKIRKFIKEVGLLDDRSAINLITTMVFRICSEKYFANRVKQEWKDGLKKS
jgi:hypothetical protein